MIVGHFKCEMPYRVQNSPILPRTSIRLQKNARPGEPERAFDVTPLQGATDGKYHVLVTPVTTEA
ncbi:hypothetical protein SAMN02910291_00682 [Desulfovibrio desulfuricans]|uniref:Uncharacterized protein n=1 Tax=Desulfovibrio desulfuricans TaxID=876 RepID=A0AA94HRA1_DESDE|nr:hypothetical protein CNY67_00370 [Desulfovibrio sp. G11]SFW28016.1 hypothetical protein SAMN02910291_00682 [Desulfovibrio desulfuricans]SPD35498.1 Hypothetical protein DSVG11_1396 [Desulfovibrio sp. G11]